MQDIISSSHSEYHRLYGNAIFLDNVSHKWRFFPFFLTYMQLDMACRPTVAKWDDQVWKGFPVYHNTLLLLLSNLDSWSWSSSLSHCLERIVQLTQLILDPPVQSSGSYLSSNVPLNEFTDVGKEAAWNGFTEFYEWEFRWEFSGV